MTSSQEALPRWDMSVVYPGLDSDEFDRDFRSLIEDIDHLVAVFDRHAIARQTGLSVDDERIRTFETVIGQLNALLQRMITLNAYISCHVAVDSRDELAQSRRSELQMHTLKLTQLSRRFVEWIGSLDVSRLIERSPLAQEHAFMLHKAKRSAEHLMSPAQEELAAELNIPGGIAWTKLYQTYTSQLDVTLELEGEAQTLPMSAVRNLAYEPERETRRRAYEAELAAWERSAVPIAAALNSIKGQVGMLAAKRSWESPLDEALFDNNLDREILDAMLDAARESFRHFRRYLQAKARALGVERLAWYDLFAPVGEASRKWPFEETEAFILKQFGTYSERLRNLAARAFQERWIDAEPRTGKRDGASCASLRPGESRILMNYKPVVGQVSTLAHELGHAYHNLNLQGRTVLQRDTPMSLAETASTFCETIVQHAVLREAAPEEQLAILEESLRRAGQVVVDITSRLQFEQEVFDRRRNRELSVDELCGIMRDAQLATYGGGLDPDRLHPYMWAAKPHYYSSRFSFYNFPYMFGLLFGLGLYARYQADPEGFKQSYDELLSRTGVASPVDLAAQFGMDIRSGDFWRASLDVIRTDIDWFESLVEEDVSSGRVD